mmetsp:Transcript_19936/g.50809  ORF Transcript_19936/g.50809 Transcript_19936/m.50809 type:complete len:106 (+) Transcript_19936:194-511(+)
MTKITSALSTVEIRCAMMRTVRCGTSVRTTSWTRRSEAGSRALVGSSSNSNCAPRTSARATATRCRCPPERRAPDSPTGASSPPRSAMKPSAFANLAASWSCASV